MKVVRVIARLNIGGPARHVVLLDEGLRRRGYDTLLVHGSVSDGEASFEHLARDGGIDVCKIPDLGRRISPLSDLRAFGQLVAVVFRRRPDIIHTHTAKAGALGRLAALVFNMTRSRRKRAAVVHTFHGHVLSGYFGPAANAAIRIVERGLARATDCLITISPAQQQEIVRTFRIAPIERTAIVPLGLDLEPLLTLPADWPSLRPQLDIDANSIVIGYVGRFVPIKDLDTLVEAFAVAVERVPNLVLLLAGDGPLRLSIESKIEKLRIAARVRLPGWCKDLRALYATMDVGTIASRNEGTPVALIEAMAAAKPVVATAVGGVPDVIEQGRTGILVPSGDVEALGSAFVELATDLEKRRRLGGAGRVLVAERYSGARLITDIDRLYVNALAAKRGR
jgi:glycosyltransferase involved in cell wall biosynthesis